MARKNTDTSATISTRQGLLAISPIFVFLLLYVGVSLAVGDFYKMPLSIAFIVAAAWSIISLRHGNVTQRIEVFSQGAANSNVLYMIWIFILAGAFSMLASKIGAIDATVELTLHFLPQQLLLPGLFVTACFVSMSIGTSVGTIVALTPFAVQLATGTGNDVAFFVSIVLGGAYFGDNLSFISDTTIAATRSQSVKMNEKFKTNLWIALPAAIITLAIYIALGYSFHSSGFNITIQHSWYLVLPYLLVIVTAMMGINVLIVLSLGIVASLVLGLATHAAGLLGLFTFMNDGIKEMSDLIIVTLLAGGLLSVISYNGGIKYIIQALTKRISGIKGAQAVIALLVSLVNVCTANNTIAIITVGEIANKISSRYNLDPRKVASLLDTCSCIVQSILPYGAQALLAASLAKVSPIAFMPHMYYTLALALMVIASIAFNFPKSKTYLLRSKAAS